MKSCSKLVGILALLVYTSLVFADEPTAPTKITEPQAQPASQAVAPKGFVVEVIAVSKITRDNLLGEHWPTAPLQPPFKGSVALTPTNEAQTIFYTRIPVDDELSERTARLVKNDYTLLLSQAWIQPAQEATPTKVRLIGEQGHDLVGTIAVDRKRYYEVKLHMLFTLPRTTVDSHWWRQLPPDLRRMSALTLALNKKLRMRAGEIHYVDHPLYGVLIKIDNSSLQETTTQLQGSCQLTQHLTIARMKFSPSFANAC